MGTGDRWIATRCSASARNGRGALHRAGAHPHGRLLPSARSIPNARSPSVGKSPGLLPGECGHRPGHVLQQRLRKRASTRLRKCAHEGLLSIDRLGHRRGAHTYPAAGLRSLVRILDRRCLCLARGLQRMGLRPTRHRGIPSLRPGRAWHGATPSAGPSHQST